MGIGNDFDGISGPSEAVSDGKHSSAAENGSRLRPILGEMDYLEIHRHGGGNFMAGATSFRWLKSVLSLTHTLQTKFEPMDR